MCNSRQTERPEPNVMKSVIMATRNNNIKSVPLFHGHHNKNCLYKTEEEEEEEEKKIREGERKKNNS